MNQFQEGLFYHYILNEPKYLENTIPEYFTNLTVRELFKIAKEHTLKYKDAPTKEQLSELIKVKDLEEKISNDLVTAVYNQKTLLGQYDEKWLEDNTGAWIRIKNLDYTMRKAIAFMKTSPMNVENASSVVETVRSMLCTETAMDFNFEMGYDFFDPNAHSQQQLEKKSAGYPYIDTCLRGGWWKGALFAFIAGPKCGKSMWLSNLAAQSMKEGDNVAYITLELPVPIVMSRIGANLLNVSSDDYENFSKDKALLTQKLREFNVSQLKPLGHLHVKQFPTSAASSTDIANYLKKTEELLGYKFDRIYIDYINLVKNWRNPNSENLYMKIKQIAEDLRAESIINNWTIITVTQSKIGNWGGTDMTIADVSESSGLIHTVDGCFGIITNPEMKAVGEYYLKYIASRIGGFENTRKKFNILWNYCRISEDMTSKIEDMEMITQLSKNTQRSHNIDSSINVNRNSSNEVIITNNISTYTPENINITGKGLFDM